MTNAFEILLFVMVHEKCLLLVDSNFDFDTYVLAEILTLLIFIRHLRRPELLTVF